MARADRWTCSHGRCGAAVRHHVGSAGGHGAATQRVRDHQRCRGRSRDRGLSAHLVIGAYGHRPQQHGRGRHGGAGGVGHRDGVPLRERGECRPLPRPGRQGRGTGSPVRSGGWQCSRRGGHHGAARQWQASRVGADGPRRYHRSRPTRLRPGRPGPVTGGARHGRRDPPALPGVRGRQVRLPQRTGPIQSHDVPDPPPPGRFGHKQAPGQGECEQPGRVGGDQRRVAGDQPAAPAQRAGRLAAPCRLLALRCPRTR
jgi:hypothetical protein